MVCMDLYLRGRNRMLCVCKCTTTISHLCSLSAAAVGGESQEASALATRWLAVLTPIQGHQGGRWSCAVPWGERGRYKSTGQVNPRSVHAVSLKWSQGHRERTKVLFYSWFNVSLRPCSSLFPPLSVFIRQWLHGEGAALQDARARDPQWEPGKPQPGQRLLSGLRQQGVQPGSCPGWWGLTVMTTMKDKHNNDWD